MLMLYVVVVVGKQINSLGLAVLAAVPVRVLKTTTTATEMTDVVGDGEDTMAATVQQR